MPFKPNPETVYYRDVVDLLKALQEQAYTEICALEAKSDFTEAKDRERFCYLAGQKEILNKALFYLWDEGQQKEKPHPIRSHHFFLDTP
jgi:hypothetical protein